MTTAATALVPDGSPTLDPGETMIANLDPDKGRWFQHRGRIAVVTSHRLFLIKRLGSTHACALIPFDARAIRAVRQTKYLAFEAVLVGILILFVGLAIAWGGIRGELWGPGTVTLPVIAIAVGGPLVLGVLRRRIIFEIGDRRYYWISRALTYRSSAPTAKCVCDHIEKLIAGVTTAERELIAAEVLRTISDQPDDVRWRHIIVSFFAPPVGMIWGWVNLSNDKRRTGCVMFFGSFVLFAPWFYVLFRFFAHR